MVIIDFNMRNTWKTVPNSWAITIKQNVHFQKGTCLENVISIKFTGCC